MPNIHDDDNATPPIPDPKDPESNKVSDADIDAAIKGTQEPAKPATDASDDADPLKATNKGKEPAEPEKDAQQRLDELQSQYDQVQKSYDELRSKSTRDWQAAAELKKSHEDLENSFKKAVEKVGKLADASFDPEQFAEKFKTQGPKALDEYFDDKLAIGNSQRNKEVSELKNNNASLTYEVEFLRRAHDSKKYPGFIELEDKMNEIASAEDSPVNKNAPIGKVLDSLYKLATESSSGEAVKKALETGKNKAEEQLAKESKTTLAAGGKGTVGAPVDLWKIPLDKLKEKLPKAERD